MNIYNIFSLLGGLALFLYGMHLMGESLEKRAGSRLKKILEHLTRHPLRGVLLGAGVTAVIQSSSATTVMIVGFVNSGIMQLQQAISVIMGANIGTTITAWFLSLTGIESGNIWVTLLKPSHFSPILAFIGIVMLFAFKRKKDTAGILIGFAILMFGMQQMSDSVKGLAQIPAFVNLLVLFSNPFFGVAIGAAVTALIQSSSASVGILQAIANTGTLSFGSAVPIIMGQNIGTCITAILSSIGANRNAKRVAAAHLAFNMIGTILFLSIYYVVIAIWQFKFVGAPISALNIALVHTIFNLFSTAVLLPFSSKLEWLAKKIVKDDKRDESFEMLDERLLSAPAIAIEQCRKLTAEMALLARDSFSSALLLLDKFDHHKADHILELETRIDLYEDKLGSYLVEVSMCSLAQEDSREVSKLLHCIGDFERISDHSVNLVEVAEEMAAKRLHFSGSAQHELMTMRAAVSEVIDLAVDAFVRDDLAYAAHVEPLEEVIDLLRSEIKANHIMRLQAGDCTIELGFILSDLLTNLERSADHCSNIAASLIEFENSGRLEAHEYLRNLRTGKTDPEFNQKYESYRQKYAIVAETNAKA